ncbi:hypothetical protein D2M30_3115 [Bacillus amyloliquefaciens]|nr:hypothetical protein D2M30_3115 [Bacillus amyloliquefaciens]
MTLISFCDRCGQKAQTAALPFIFTLSSVSVTFFLIKPAA